ncbi:polysaccharide deacetylase family protein [Massilia horti]|uniref:polysaccharide deacetylase family protein n=1 Tax=Massilia horti TaxID=2562153 RepID=UPI001E4AE60C|nr:polysaccharide deacetylase family protein [Massilia horti]
MDASQTYLRAAPEGSSGSLLGKALMRMLSPGGQQGLSILIYHRVLDHPDPLFPGEVDRAEFDRQLRLLKSIFNVIPLPDAVRHLHEGTLPPRAACITFDDGYADNAQNALPLLLAHGLHATFFVATGFLDGGRMWNDTVIELARRAQGEIDARGIKLGLHPAGTVKERQAAIGALIGQLKYLPLTERLEQVARLADAVGCALPNDLMMSSNQVRQLHRCGMEIGGHTVRHPILARLDLDAARAEIANGKRALEDLTGAPVRLFAYPNGKPGTDYRAEHVQMVRELGFEAAVSTAWGAQRGATDLYQLPRFTPWDRGRLRFTLRLAQNLRVPAERA